MIRYCPRCGCELSVHKDFNTFVEYRCSNFDCLLFQSCEIVCFKSDEEIDSGHNIPLRVAR